jgi:hypothetical protein
MESNCGRNSRRRTFATEQFIATVRAHGLRIDTYLVRSQFVGRV